MASIAHLAVGMSAARLMAGHEKPSWRSMAAWSALSMLPDADVVGFGLGVAYEDALGHRGASHSLLFAAVVGVIAALFATRFGLPRLRTCMMATAVVASHALLDTLTDGGLGCALFWPFDLTRYFAPWRPIPVSPIGLAFFSPYGAFVSAIELILFGPLVFFALRRTATTMSRSRAKRAVLLTFWAVLVWLIGSTDPLRQALFGAILRADTEYASGFSERAFAAISAGMAPTDVRRLVGAPLEESWYYYATESQSDCRLVRLAHEVVRERRSFDGCMPADVPAGMASQDVLRQLGPPTDAIWQYSRGRSGGWFQARNVFFLNGKVDETLQRWSPSEASPQTDESDKPPASLR